MASYRLASPRNTLSPLPPFLHGGRSTAASPLQASFLTSRSPGPLPGASPLHELLLQGYEDDDEEDSDDRDRTMETSSPRLGVLSAVNMIVGRTIGVGAFSVPAAVLAGVGSVGGALALWAAGAALSFCGLAVYLELGTALPRSGGERVYLERLFRRPARLAASVCMAHVVLLGFSAPNALVLGEYALRMTGKEHGRAAVRAVAVAAVTVFCVVHARRPRLGLALVNVLGVAKLVLLGGVVAGGVAAAVRAGGPGSGPSIRGHGRDPDMSPVGTLPGSSAAARNFGRPWAGASAQPYDYATALLKVLYCFRGYSTANQVLSDVRDPVRTLRVAAPLALALVALAYGAVNVAFFLVVDRAALQAAGVAAAGVFFETVLGGDGPAARLVPPAVVVVSAAGNIAATAFAQARVNEELARDGLLPGGAFWATRGGTGTAPVRGLLLHWLVSVVVIVAPPSDKIYSFLVDLGAYPVSVLGLALAGGLLALRARPACRWSSPAPAPRAAIAVFGASNALLLVLPWIPPAGGRGESDRFASYAYPAGGLAVLASGALYWCWWRAWGGGRRRMRARLSLAALDGRRRRAPCGCLAF